MLGSLALFASASNYEAHSMLLLVADLKTFTVTVAIRGTQRSAMQITEAATAVLPSDLCQVAHCVDTKELELAHLNRMRTWAICF